jgi:hypothetical protein
MGSGLASGFWRLVVWEGAACDWRSKKWRMPNLAGCDGCEGGGGFFDAAAAAARFRGAMAARVEDWRREAGFGGRRWNGKERRSWGLEGREIGVPARSHFRGSFQPILTIRSSLQAEKKLQYD